MSFLVSSFSPSYIIAEILPKFLEKFENGGVSIDPKLARDLLILLIRYDGVNVFLKEEVCNPTFASTISLCKVEQLLQKCFHGPPMELMPLSVTLDLSTSSEKRI